MPYDVDGWVEFSYEVLNGDEDPPTWKPLLSLSPFVLHGDAISQFLFGLAKASDPSAPFYARGIPPDASPLVQQAYAENLEFIAQYGEGDFGHTFALLSEIQSVDFSNFEAELRESPWSEVFKAVSALPPRLVEAPKCLRFVVWANW